MRTLFKALLVLLAAAVPAANAQEGSLRQGPAAIVAAVVDGDTVVLKNSIDGATQVRLVGIQAPKLPLGRKGFPTWPLAAEAKQALAKLVLGKTVSLSFGGTEKDRHGRLLAHLHRQDGVWVQGRMLSLGMARVYSFPDNRARVAEMLYEARTKAGLTQKELADLVGTKQPVIARLEDAEYQGHSLTMLQRIATALDRHLEIRLTPVKGNLRPARRAVPT